MDGSSDRGNNPNDASGGGRRSMTQSLQDQIAALTREAQALAEKAKPYRAEARQQAEAVVPTIPTWQRMLAVSRDTVLLQTEGLVAALAATNGDSLTQTQVQAVSDSIMSNVRTAATINLGLFVLTLGLSYRHSSRIRQRLPDQVKAKMGTITREIGWPVATFMVYSIPIYAFIKPSLTLYSARHHARKLREDPRLSGLSVDIAQTMRAESARFKAEFTQTTGVQLKGQTVQLPPQRPDATPSWAGYLDKGEETSSTSSSRPADWDPDTSGSPAAQQEHSGWDDGGASPVAQPGRNTSPNAGLSAWDRLRNETNSRNLQEGRGQRPQQQPSRATWGSDSGSKESHAPNDYSFSSNDQDRNVSKDQAQQDFDRLLERERQGSESGRDSWGKR